MKKNIFYILCGVAVFLQGCSASVSSNISNSQTRLSRQYHKIVIMASGSGSISNSLVSIFDGQLNQVTENDGNQQIFLAAQSIAFECGKMGFQVVSAEDNPDLILEFMIGSIRFDEIAGWIADAGYITIRDAKSNLMIAQYEAKTMFITPTVNNIISSLISEIKKIY